MSYAIEPPREGHIWDCYYELLLSFVDRKGHADVPRQHIEKGFALGIWVHKQQSQKDFLTPAQRASLEEIECWFWANEPSPTLRPNPFMRTDLSKAESAPASIDAKADPKPIPAQTKPRRTIVSIDSKNRLVQKSSDGSIKTLEPDEDKKQKETDIWQSRYRLLFKYVNREGDCLVLANHIEEGFNLGTWVVRQRLERNKMTAQQRDLLESLDGWYWDIREGKWDKTFHLLEQFCQREGTAKVSANHIEEGVKLGIWTTNQKQYYRQKKLDLNRKEKLEKLPGWNWERRDVNWENNFLLLQQYYDREGTVGVPGGHVEEGFGLGQWVFAQRRMYRNGKLKVERQEKLEQLPGWEWERERGKKLSVEKPSQTISKTAGKQWESMFRLLVKYGKREGHYDVPESHEESGKELGKWVKNQREVQAMLLPEHCELLESLDGWSWETQQMPCTNSEQVHAARKKAVRSRIEIGSKPSVDRDTWESRFQLLLQFGRRKGHHRVPSRHVEDGVKLGTWVVNLRKKAEKLPPDQYKRLDSLHGWSWNPHEAQWSHYYELLQNFVAREGHAMVSKGHFEDGSNLGVWVSHQRDQYRRGELAINRVEQLDKVRGWQWLGYEEILSETDIDNLAQDVWKALFGLGEMTETVAAHTAVKSLHRAGIVRARLARPGSQMHADVLKAFNRGIELGIMDRPAEEKIRAVLTEPEFYELEDWDMCIEATLTENPVNRKAAVEAAAYWANNYLGLEFDAIKLGDAIHNGLSEALARAIEKRTVIRLPRGMVRGIKK